MRKSIAYILVFTMLLSFGWTSFGVESAKAAVGVDEQVVADFSDEIDIRAKTGLISGQDSNHGNHQTRVVRTSHGSYVAYVTDYRGGKYLQHPTQGLSEISVMKINKDGTVELIMQHVKSYDSSQVSLIVDKDENVWAGLVYENGFRDQFDAHKNGMVLEFFRIDAETDEVNGYSTIVSDIDINGGGIGYGTFYYDKATNSIVAMAADAVPSDPSYLYWKVFNLDTLTWSPETHSMRVNGGRNAYMFFNPDNKGGLVVVTNRNPYVRSSVTYFPELENDEGLTPEIMIENGMYETRYDDDGNPYKVPARQHVSYCFDQINAYVIPDINSSDYTHFIVYDTDHSRITGTSEERITPEFRSKNEYPNIANNNGGDIFLDNDGNLHVTLKVSYVKMAWDWEVTEERWVHVVYDTKTGEKLSETEIWDSKKWDLNFIHVCTRIPKDSYMWFLT